jgi:hypothetical protein
MSSPLNALARALALVLGCASCGPGGRTAADAPPASDSPVAADAGPDALVPDFSKVYAHSGTQLYRVDTITLAPQLVGPISGLGTQSLTDLAIDGDDRMLGVTLDKLYELDPATGAATLVTELMLDGFTSLCFVPTDLNNPNSPEELIAANDQGAVYRIDQVTGAATLIGDYGTTANGKIRSSGDIVAISGFGLYATVTIGDTLSDPDYLARIDPVTWAATPLGIGTDYDRIFGLGFWRGTIYGFVDTSTTTGAFISLDPNTGASTLLEAGAIRWYGAGVTTDAPIIE